MPSKKTLSQESLKHLQGLFFWLRIISPLFFIGGLWQAIVGIGLLVGLKPSGFFSLLVGVAIFWLGKLLFDSSKILSNVNPEQDQEETNKILLDLTKNLHQFFKWTFLFAIIAIAGSLLLSFIAVLLVVDQL